MRPLDALLGEATVDALYDIVALPHLAQRYLCVLLEHPAAGFDLLCQSEPLQAPETSDLEHLERIRTAVWCGRMSMIPCSPASR